MHPVQNSDRVQWTILDLLLEQHAEPQLVGEIVEEIGSPALVAEALEALQAAGLIEHSGEAVALSP